ncbi:MAG: tetratricopeptide repeat protein [candidate division Zixibacteria bacterium]|nr:tetratricopeptide repeat protein [candidate division Zixibacteria bacterium]
MASSMFPTGIRNLFVVTAVVLMALSGNLFPQEEFPQPAHYMQLQKAGQFVERGLYEEALDILLELVDKEPSDPVVLGLLQKVYTESKDYDKAIEVVGRLEKLLGGTPEVCLSYGDLFLKKGLPDSARKHFGRALAGNESDRMVYPRIANVYRSNGIYDGAIAIYLDAKIALGDESLFSYELGQLYEVSRNYGKAIRQYFAFMMSDTTNAARGERLIQHLIDYVDDSADIARLKVAFSDLAESEKKNFRPRKFLADMLIRQDSLERAYELYKEIDKLTDDKGSFLVFFARRCLERQSPEIASRACQYVLDQYPSQPYFIQARYVLSSAHIMAGEGDSAIAVLNEIVESTPSSRDKVEANLVIGEIYLGFLQEPDSASVYFDMVMDGVQKSGWYYRALMRKGDCELMRGDLADAESLYGAIELRLLPEADQEKLTWNRAQIKFFNHEFEDAKQLYGRLTTTFRKGLYVNDCLRKLLMIDENVGFAQYDLGLFADAECFIARTVYDSAKVKLSALSEKSGSNLADVSMFKLGELYLALEESEKALETFMELLNRFQDSFYRGESQKNIADLYLAQGDLQGAQDAYLKLLTDYDGVLLQEHAREKLRLIENPQL